MWLVRPLIIKYPWFFSSISFKFHLQSKSRNMRILRVKLRNGTIYPLKVQILKKSKRRGNRLFVCQVQHDTNFEFSPFRPRIRTPLKKRPFGGLVYWGEKQFLALNTFLSERDFIVYGCYIELDHMVLDIYNIRSLF